MSSSNSYISSLSCMQLDDNLNYLYAGDFNGHIFIWPLKDLIENQINENVKVFRSKYLFKTMEDEILNLKIMNGKLIM